MAFFGSIQFAIVFIVTVAGFAVELWALIHCATRPASAFPAAGKRTKTFWLLITGAAALVGLLALLNRLSLFLALIAAGAAIVYLVDVRPAVSTPRRGGGRPGRSGGSW